MQTLFLLKGMKFEMSDAFIFRTLLEGVFALFLIWGLFNEEKFVAFEDKIKNKIKRGKHHG